MSMSWDQNADSVSWDQNAGRSDNIKTENNSFERVKS